MEKIAKINGKTCPITIKDLQDIDELYDESELEKKQKQKQTPPLPPPPPKNNRLIKEKLKKYNLSHVRQCFTTSKNDIINNISGLVMGSYRISIPII